MRKKKLFRLPSLNQWIGILLGLLLCLGGISGFSSLLDENRELTEFCLKVVFVAFLVVEGGKLVGYFLPSIADDREETEK